MPDHREPPPTADRLRIDIDRGKAGDKVDFPDPAAAPLGTDAEAGGHPPTPEELAMAEAPVYRAEQAAWLRPAIFCGVIAIALLGIAIVMLANA